MASGALLAALNARRDPFPGATFGADFRAGRYKLGRRHARSILSLGGASFTRASVGYAETASGLLVAFASGAPRITDKGFLSEESRTNAVLHNRDLTNAAWVKSNATAAKDQTGADGVANSASSLTATAGNATALQAITLGSSARFQSCRIKRLVGSGVVEMTMDNGSTWTAVTVTASWTRVSIPTQTLANPTVGFRIVTSGDAIAVDLFQNENGTFASSDIPTTTASATRAADGLLVNPLAGFNAAEGCLLIEALAGDATPTGSYYAASLQAASTNDSVTIQRLTTPAVRAIVLGDGGSSRFNNLTTAWPNSTAAKVGVSYKVADYRACFNGGTVVTGANATTPIFANVPDRFAIGSIAGGNQFNGYVRRVVYFPRAFSSAELQGATA